MDAHATHGSGAGDALCILEIFIDSIDELLSSSFLQQARSGGIGTTLSWETGGLIKTERRGPDNEAVKAFILTLRFFCQDNERTSIRNMDGTVQGLPIDPELKDAFSGSRTSLNAFLDQEPSTRFVGLVGAETRRHIFEAFTYGLFAHANASKRRTLKEWEESGAYDDLRSEYDAILLGFLRHLRDIRDISKQVVEALQRGTPGPARSC